LTPVQKARRQGFNASLKQRGVTLTLNELSFMALVQPVDSDSGEFTVSEATRNASRIHILRESAGAGQIEIGNVLLDNQSGRTHRVTEIDDHPTNIVFVFHCETADSE
jgi:hypothetical protein